MSETGKLPNAESARQFLLAARSFFQHPYTSGLTQAEQNELDSIIQQLGRRNFSQDSATLPLQDKASRIYFDYALTGILESDANWHILRSNPAAASITGYDAKLLQGRLLTEWPDQESIPVCLRHVALLQEQGISRSEWQLQRRDGKFITIEIASIQVEENYFIHVFDDVTEQRIFTAEIERARNAAEDANRSKSQFLANISHEIRTPMNGIIGLSQLLQLSNLSAQQQDYAAKITQSGLSLLKIINELLDFSKIEAKRIEFESVVFSLDEILDELSSLAVQLSLGKKLEIVFQVPPDLPRFWTGDRTRLLQCLNNLLANAIKFTSDGKVELDIAIAGEMGHKRLRFSMIDTGIGIDAAALSRLFKPFIQADASTTRRFGGTGLGLVITQALAQGMEGNLLVESQVGKGSRFTLELPLIPAGSPIIPPMHGGKAIVLISRPSTRSSTVSLLTALGWQVEAPDPQLFHFVLNESFIVESGSPDDLIVVDSSDKLMDCQEYVSNVLPPNGPALLWIADQEQVTPALERASTSPRIATVTRPLTPASLVRALQYLQLNHTSTVAGLNQLSVPDEFRGAHILVAEDNPVNQLVIVEWLRLAGITTTLLNNGQEAVDTLLSSTTLPDLVLMDVQMPILDGLEATRILRNQGFVLPIIGLSAGASKAEEANCLAAGMNDFLPKPIDNDELWGALTRWIPPRDIHNNKPVAETAESRFQHNAGILSKARQAFIQGHGTDFKNLMELYARNEITTMLRIAHSLKGAASTIGADELAHLARSLEEALSQSRNNSPATQGVDSLIKQIGAEMTLFISTYDKASAPRDQV